VRLVADTWEIYGWCLPATRLSGAAAVGLTRWACTPSRLLRELYWEMGARSVCERWTAAFDPMQHS